MRVCIVDIETGARRFTGGETEAARRLKPGTVYGTGRTSHLAQIQAMHRRKVALGLPDGWKMPSRNALALSRVPTNQTYHHA